MIMFTAKGHRDIASATLSEEPRLLRSCNAVEHKQGQAAANK
jgi:hypothetical protein